MDFLGGSREWSTRSWCMLMHHLRAGGKVDDGFRELAHPPRSVVSSFVQVSSFFEMIFFADARTLGVAQGTDVRLWHNGTNGR